MHRGLTLALLSCAVAGAGAQSDSERQFEAGRTADLQNWEWRARQGIAPSEAEKAVQAVVDAVSQRDCAAAAAKLNAGLAKAYPEVMVLAGVLYEDGVCLKPNWQRAVGFYEKAAAAGRAEALARIAAGYAAPVGGRDMAAALWWSLRAKTPLPAPCAQVGALADDADRFVAALKAWPAGQLNACVHAAAVMATIQSEAAWPGLGAAHGLQGKVRISFVPERGQIDIVEDLAVSAPKASVVADPAAREREQRTALSGSLRQLADRALKRYDKPNGIPAAWRVEAEYVYADAR
jgi:TPR repeat protein